MVEKMAVGGPSAITKILEAGGAEDLGAVERALALARWRAAVEAARLAKRPVPILETLRADETALLVVDMQKAFVDPGAAIEVPAARRIVPNINRLAQRIRESGGRVVFFRYSTEGDVGLLPYFERESYLGVGRVSPLVALRCGHPQFELAEQLEVESDDLVLEKTRYSAVLGSRIEEVLSTWGIRNTIVTGATTDVCAGNTAECLMQRDYFVVMVWDATAALSRLEHELYLARIFGLYGDVMTTEEVISRLVA